MNIFLTAAKEIVLKKEEKRLIEIIRDVLAGKKQVRVVDADFKRGNRTCDKVCKSTRSLTVFAGMSCIYGGTVSGKTGFFI